MILPVFLLIIQGVFVGLGLGHGEMAFQLNAHLVAQLDQINEGFCGRGAVEPNIADDDDVVAGPVGAQNGAVAVQNLAPGRFDGGIVGQCVRFLQRNLVHGGLNFVQPEGEQAHDQQNHRDQTDGTDSRAPVHTLPPTFPMALASR